MQDSSLIGRSCGPENPVHCLVGVGTSASSQRAAQPLIDTRLALFISIK
jgi:hypothetical protein